MILTLWMATTLFTLDARYMAFADRIQRNEDWRRFLHTYKCLWTKKTKQKQKSQRICFVNNMDVCVYARAQRANYESLAW